MKDYVIFGNSRIYASIISWIDDKTYLGYTSHTSMHLKILKHDILIFQIHGTDFKIIINTLNNYSE